MRTRIRPLLACMLVVPLALLASTPPANAFHFYRGPGSGCSPTDGPITDDAGTPGEVGAVVEVGHNTFNDTLTGFDIMPAVVHVTVGKAVKWEWKSAHCHSIQSTNGALGSVFYSGFHYPTQAPESPQVAPGAFDYPVLDDTPTLSYTHTFNTVGTYTYRCEHHEIILMTGTVVVDPA